MSAFLSTLELSPLADGRGWRLNEFFVYRSDVLLQHSEDGLIEVPKGFVTDLASIPRALWAILPPWERYGPAAVVHDWLYWDQAIDRDMADAVLREAMEVLGVAAAERGAIYRGVRVGGGQAAWDRNTALKASGYSRMASPNNLPPYAAP